jgi:beta-lactamase superfamily II metal-dependent hydrolase
MPLVMNRSYYLAVTDAVLRASADSTSAPRNHLIYGDWLKYLGEQDGNWAKVKCRGDTGWLRQSEFSEQRALEVNFVDIGQGDGCHIVTPDDKIVLVDAGEGENMFRFLSWRYNLRDRKVAGVDGATAGEPLPIDHVVISHPDSDHYFGFKPLLESRKVRVQNIYHNGIAERPIKPADKDPELWYPAGDDLGGYVKTAEGETYLWDVVASNSQMHALVAQHPTTNKFFLATMRAAVGNNPNIVFTALNRESNWLPGFDESQALRLKVLGPVSERISFGNQTRNALQKLGNEGVTKNGHSVILQLQIGRLKVMLGGDLNTESEDHLFRHYCATPIKVSELEKDIGILRAQGDSISDADRQDLNEKAAELEAIVVKARGHFQADITKACHHGSHHFSESFLRAINAIVTVVSSGDDESYAHPRPDALGSFGKYGRGLRPLIFSTELARNTKEFTHIWKYFEELKEYEAKLAAATTAAEKAKLTKAMQERKDRNVAVYGMITLRTNGEKVVMAQKLEVPGGNDNKWDIHEFWFNPLTSELEYIVSAKHD